MARMELGRVRGFACRGLLCMISGQKAGLGVRKPLSFHKRCGGRGKWCVCCIGNVVVETNKSGCERRGKKSTKRKWNWETADGPVQGQLKF